VLEICSYPLKIVTSAPATFLIHGADVMRTHYYTNTTATAKVTGLFAL